MVDLCSPPALRFTPCQAALPAAMASRMGSMFNQWIDGRPWWMTLLLLPAIVIAAAFAKLLRDAVIAGVVAIVVIGLAIWAWRRRR